MRWGLKEWLLLTPAWIATAWLISRVQWFWSHWPELQFGWIVLLLAGYLFWEAAQAGPPLKPKFGMPMVALLLVGFGLMFAFQIYQTAMGISPASLWGLAIGVMAVVSANLLYLAGHRGLWHFVAGFAFLLLALPMPSIIQGPLIGGLQSGIATLNVEALNLMGVPAQRVGNLIQLPNCTVGVDEACSGIRSLQSSLMATLFIGQISLNRTGTRGLLFVLGIILALAGNLVRSLVLSYQASQHGLVALEEVHDAAGWSILAATVVGTALAAWLLHRLELHGSP